MTSRNYGNAVMKIYACRATKFWLTKVIRLLFFITELDGFFQSYQLSHIAENKTSTSFSSYERDLIIDCSVYSIAICVTSM